MFCKLPQRVLASAIIVFYLCSLPFYASAYIPVLSEIKGMFDRELRKSTQHMAQGVRTEVEAAMQTLFNTHMRPFLTEFDTMLGARISQGDEAAEQRLEQVREIILDLMASIEQQVSSIDSLRARFVQDIRRIQSDIVDNFRCAADGALEKAASKLSDLRDTFRLTWWERYVSRREYYWQLDACYTHLGLNYDVEEWQYSQLYDIKKCIALRRLNLDSRASVIMNAYLDLSNYSQSMRCLQYGAGKIADDKYSTEFFELSRKYNLWRFASDI